ncbi:hypothetical protein AGMMS49936_10700 [Endomicrobiia bacterium]|nr:hypothetical protein AGMMS49936_10700 [Endomicrobiia bacterium]
MAEQRSQLDLKMEEAAIANRHRDELEAIARQANERPGVLAR